MICVATILVITAGVALFVMGFLSGWHSGKGMW